MIEKICSKKNVISTKPESTTRNLLLICDCGFMIEK